MAEVLQALKAPLMIPMHYFSTYSLRRFLDVLGEKSFEVEMSETPSLVVSKTTLPAKPKLLVLPGRAVLSAALSDQLKFMWIASNVRIAFAAAQVAAIVYSRQAASRSVIVGALRDAPLDASFPVERSS